MNNRTSWTWQQAIARSDLAPTTRHVLLTLALYMNQFGKSAYPTTLQLAEATGLSERSVITHLQTAFDAGWLRKRQHGFKGRNWKNNEYEAAWPSEIGDGSGTELGSAAFEQGTEPPSRGTEPNDNEALKEVQSTLPDTIPLTSNSKKGTRIADDWQPSQADMEFARDEGFGGIAITREAARFKDYWMAQPGQKGVKLDWPATWRNWVRNSADRQKPSQKSDRHFNQDVLEAFADLAQESRQ